MKSMIALLLAAAAAGSVLEMEGTLDSKIKMGNAVFAGYCASDLTPSVSRVYTSTAVTKAGFEHDINLIVENVKSSCAGNGGRRPCATDAGADKFPAFVCRFTDSKGKYAVVESPAVQAIARRIGSIDTGIENTVTCKMPARENTDHTVVVSLVYRGTAETKFAYNGIKGKDRVFITSTAAPTSAPTFFPTQQPTNVPTQAPTQSPTPVRPTGCENEVNLNPYFRGCRASSYKAPTTISYFNRAGFVGRTGRFRFFFYFYTYFNRGFFSSKSASYPCAKAREGHSYSDQGSHFETAGRSPSPFLKWDFKEAVVVTRIIFQYATSAGNSMQTRSGGVTVTGNSGGVGSIGSGKQATHNVNWGLKCKNCPKGSTIKLAAVKGFPWGGSTWGVEQVRMYGCLKSKGSLYDSQAWDHVANAALASGACPRGYHDQNKDGACELCRTPTDCGIGKSWTGECTTKTDMQCVTCKKPEHSRFTLQGKCNFICIDNYTGKNCTNSNICADAKLQMVDAFGDGWSGAEAHIDAYTGKNQFTHIDELNAKNGDKYHVQSHPHKLEGAQTRKVDRLGKYIIPFRNMSAWKNIGCRKNGCYQVHWSELGKYPGEISILDYFNNPIMAKGELKPNAMYSHNFKAGEYAKGYNFHFIVIDGRVEAATAAQCMKTEHIVQVGSEPTRPPGSVESIQSGLAGMKASGKIHALGVPSTMRRRRTFYDRRRRCRFYFQCRFSFTRAAFSDARRRFFARFIQHSAERRRRTFYQRRRRTFFFSNARRRRFRRFGRFFFGRRFFN